MLPIKYYLFVRYKIFTLNILKLMRPMFTVYKFSAKARSKFQLQIINLVLC